MKKIIKNALFSVLMVVFMISAEVMAFAETKTGDLITLDADTNITVCVGYETEEPTVSFVSPDGTEIKEGSTGVEVNRDTEGKKIYFQIAGAKAGDWKIVYDKKSNSQISVDVGRFSNGIWIESVTPGKLEGNMLEVNLEVSQTANIRYDYNLYAAVVDAEGKMTGQKLLSSGSAVANEPLTTRVDMSSLGSSTYYIFAEISTTDNGVYVFDEMLSETSVNFVNADALPPVEDLFIEVNLSDETMIINWSDYCNSNGEKIIGVFADGVEEPVFAADYNESKNFVTVDIDKTQFPFTVEFTYKDGDRISETFKKVVDLKDYEINMTTPDVVTSYNALFEYKVPEEITLDINADEVLYQLVIKDEGNFSVKLNKNYSEIYLSYLRNDNILVNQIFNVVVDDIAPDIEFFENITTIRTHNETFDIIGSVEAGANLEVDGKKIETSENGGFKHNVKLKEGNNRFEFIATDDAGNRTLRRIEIIRQAKTSATAKVVDDGEKEEGFFKKNLALFVTLGVSLSVAIVAIVLSFKKKITDNKKFIYKGIMIFLMGVAALSLVGIVALLIYRYNLYKKIGPDNFLKALDSAMNEAYENILRYNNIGDYLKILLVVFVVTTVASLVMVLVTIIPKKLRNKKPKVKKTAEKAEEIAPVKVDSITENVQEKQAESPKTETSKFCKKCGAELNGAKFCKKCGEKA